MVVPEIIELENVILRKPILADAKLILEFASDPSTVKYMDWPLESNIRKIEERILEKILKWENQSAFSWSIVKRDKDKVIGTISIFPEKEKVELGFVINRNYWNKGYATECAKGILKVLSSIPEVTSVWATCDCKNIQSSKVLDKIGMEKDKILRDYCIRPNISSDKRDAYLYKTALKR